MKKHLATPKLDFKNQYDLKIGTNITSLMLTSLYRNITTNFIQPVYVYGYLRAQLCLTLCNPVSIPGSSVHGILLARILEWVANPLLRDRT